MALHFVPSILAALCIALTIAGLFFATDGTGLYGITLSYSVGTSAVVATSTTGIYEQCFETCTTTSANVQTCTPSACWEPTLSSTCTTASEGRAKWMGVQFSLFGASALQLALFFTIVGNSSSLAIARILISVFGFLAYGAFAACVALYFYFWIGCDKKVCNDYLAGTMGTAGVTYTDCHQDFVWPFWLFVVAGSLSIFQVVFAILAKGEASPDCATKDSAEQSSADQEEAQAQAGGASTAAVDPIAQQRRNDDPQEEAADEEEEEEDAAAKKDDTTTADEAHKDDASVAAAAAQEDGEEEEDDLYPIPEGDWVPDEDSGMHWSDEQWMYFHRESGQFYDPEADMWWSDEIGDWYKAEDYYDEDGEYQE